MNIRKTFCISYKHLFAEKKNIQLSTLFDSENLKEDWMRHQDKMGL